MRCFLGHADPYANRRRDEPTYYANAPSPTLSHQPCRKERELSVSSIKEVAYRKNFQNSNGFHSVVGSVFPQFRLTSDATAVPNMPTKRAPPIIKPTAIATRVRCIESRRNP